MEKLIIAWIGCGLIGYLIDQIRPRMKYETPISFIRGLFGGLATTLFVWVAIVATPANNEMENEIY